MKKTDALIVSGRVRLRADKVEAAQEAALKMAQASRSEEGCREYRIFCEVGSPTTLVLFEIWDNVDAMTRNFQTAHMAEFRETLKKVASGEPEVKRYVVAA